MISALFYISWSFGQRQTFPPATMKKQERRSNEKERKEARKVGKGVALE